ncbi:hypothetical protein [Flavivirga jejuensis]|uniref:Uncharacterized protein n=1 Tax=Flavivirga jejuensis TaxID=870487 RepID=A0ABT8WUS6_9FLAO|nr:hypothetical protein [Flavivirga jejuensis]MDO5976938.1 hypothetical protein [Flavivirga jejuensis]
MICLNYSNLDNETQQKLLLTSKKGVERQFGNSLKSYAKENHLDYDVLLETEAQRNLYSYDYVFNI